MKRLSRRGVLGGLLLAVAGCTPRLLPGGGEPARLYVLSPKSTFDPDLPTVDWQLTIDVPLAEAGLATQRIALRPRPLALEYFGRANWVDTAPRMIQTLLVESFDNTGRIVSVGRQSVTLRADYSLITEMREFQAEYNGREVPEVRVRLGAKLVRMPQREIIATTSVERIESAADRSMDSIVAAFDEALGKVIRRIVQWTLTTPPPRIGDGRTPVRAGGRL